MRTGSMKSNASQQKAKDKKNDEYYTFESDIATELQHYDLRGKRVMCCCDDPRWSKFYEFLHKNFTVLGLKSLISTYFSTTERVYKTVYLGGSDADIASYTERSLLNGTGDFASEEVQNIMDREVDIVITNPPFSIIRELIARFHLLHKDFIIIAPLESLSYKVVFPHLIEGTMYVGYNEVKKFWTDTGKILRVACIWLTSVNTGRHEFIKLRLTKKYYDASGKPFFDVEKRYCHYDGIDEIINVDSVKEIPSDYFGYMGVGLNFMEWYSPLQFKVLCDSTPRVNGAKKFHRLIIQRIEAYNPEDAQRLMEKLDLSGCFEVRDVDKEVKASSSGKSKKKGVAHEFALFE